MKTRLSWGRTSILLLVFSFACAHAQERDLAYEREHKVALVIGNSRYISSPRLNAAGNSNAVSRALAAAKFEVLSANELDLKSLNKTIDRFIASLRQEDIVVTYFSGQALQIDGDNYLLPVDFEAKDEGDAKYLAYALGRLHDHIQTARVKLNVIILDAAWPSSLPLARSLKPGLAPINGGLGSVIISSVAPGKTAEDLPGSNLSLFTGFLVDALQTPGLDLDKLFQQVRTKVYEASEHRQLPVMGSSSETQFSFVTKQQAAATPRFESELRNWLAIKTARTSDTFKAHLRAFPDGVFREGANLRIAELREPAQQPPAIAPGEPPKFSSAKIPKIGESELKETFEFGQADIDFLNQSQLLDKKLELDGLVSNDKDVEAYVKQVGQSILPSATPPERVVWRFRVLRDPEPNAFALPNGSIYVHSGLLAILDNESHLASVLAHEITHVTGRHSYRENRSRRKKALAVNVINTAAQYAGDTKLGSALQILNTVLPVVLVYTIAGYSRELEREADLYAINKLFDTGYDPRDMANAFRHLQKQYEVQLRTIYYSDHPKLEDRIAYVENYIQSKASRLNDATVVHTEQYRSATEAINRANIQLAIAAGKHRTAAAMGRRLVDWNPKSSENLFALAEAYRALGGRTMEIQPQELSSSSKRDVRKMKQKFTPQEEEAALEASLSKEVLAANTKKADELYQSALDLDRSNAKVYRSLGFLYEKRDVDRARSNFYKYLELQLQAVDRTRIRQRIEALDKSLKPSSARD